MTEKLVSMGPHDVGGQEGEAIDVVDHGMTHWEKHANALRMTVSGIKIGTLDEMRRAAEDLGDRYNQLSYFEKQTEALSIVLAEKGVISDRELQTEMRKVEKRFDVPLVSLPQNHDHDGKPIQEEEKGEGPNTYHVMNLAMQEILERKGLVSSENVRQKIEKFDGDYPNRGAKVVAKCWVDEDFKERLLMDANPVIEEIGIDLEHAARVIALENTPEIHNVIVCTLCSCYPRQLMGQPPTWYKSRSYRSRVVFEPRAVLKEFGTRIPENVKIRCHDSNADMRYFIIPMRPEGTRDWSEEELEKIISRDCLVGVSVPNVDSKMVD
ncbi:MAG: nitrile hydratase subunit alpha [Pseudomonadota bacterium]|nr:nitrile hydratase subunit alpha [Pseudomonadota bacterium]